MVHCILCGDPFRPRPTHPMCESAWCSSCWETVKERIELYGYPGGLPAVAGHRSETI